MINSYNRIREATRGKKYTYFCDHCAYAPADAARADIKRTVLSNGTFKPDSTKLKLISGKIEDKYEFSSDGGFHLSGNKIRTYAYLIIVTGTTGGARVKIFCQV